MTQIDEHRISDMYFEGQGQSPETWKAEGYRMDEFGCPITYTIESANSTGCLLVTVDPPDHSGPRVEVGKAATREDAERMANKDHAERVAKLAWAAEETLAQMRIWMK